MINLLQWNVRSLPVRLPSIQNLISSYKCSIILISETWLLPSRNCFIPHFNLFRQDRTDGYGGVAIAAHTSLNVSLIEINPSLKQLLLENNIDLIGIKIANIDGLPNTSFWSCYSPNDSLITPEVWLSLFQLAEHNSFFTGDLNAHHPAWGFITPARRGDLIYDALNSVNLNIPNNGSPTHVGRPNSTNSCIDLSLTTPNLFWLSTWRIIDDPNGSDHLPIIISVNTTDPNFSPNNRPTVISPLTLNLISIKLIGPFYLNS
jgi:exonuclease III